MKYNDKQDQETEPVVGERPKIFDHPGVKGEYAKLYNVWKGGRYAYRSYSFCSRKCLDYKSGAMGSEESSCFESCLDGYKSAFMLLRDETNSFILQCKDIENRGKSAYDEFQI